MSLVARPAALLRGLLYGIPRSRALSPEQLAGLAESQALAYSCAKMIARELREGWTEAQAARLMDVYLRDCGVRVFFHRSFAWFGERTRFDGMRRWRDFSPSSRPLKPGEAVILDTAPVYRGYPADIGYPTSLGPNESVQRGRQTLADLRQAVLELFSRGLLKGGITGGDICEAIARRIRKEGYDPVHHRYPGAVLGHRLHPLSEGWRPPTFIPFGWAALSRLLSQGVYPDLLNEEHQGDLAGAWAIEPHLGGPGFGCKFEEVFLADDKVARWLSPGIPW